MKKNLCFVLMCLVFQLNAQHDLCDLPEEMGMYDIPLSISIPFGEGENVILPKKSIVLHERVNLVFPNDFISLNWIEINFNNGAGWQEVQEGEALQTTYTTSGLKEIFYKYSFSAYGDIEENSFKIEVKTTSDAYSFPDLTWDISSNATFTLPVANIYPDDSPFAGNQISTATAYIKYAEGHTALVKPIIFVPGYDPGKISLTDPDNDDKIIRHGGNGWDTFIRGANEEFVHPTDDRETFRNYPKTANGFSQEGYDLVFLDFKLGDDYIQKNAELLIELISRVNEEKSADTNGNFHPNIVMGASMGGLVTRYALKKMEQRNIPHCTKTFIAFDTGMKGSTAPVGVQSAIWFSHAMAQDTPELNDDKCGANLWNTLAAPAARQMIENHIGRLWEEGIANLWLNYFEDNGSVSETPIPVDLGAGYSTLRNSFLSELSDLGYPDKCTRVAVACGNQTGTGQGYDSGTHLFKAQLIRDAALGGDKRITELEILAGQGGEIEQQCNNFCIDLGFNPNFQRDIAVFGAILPHSAGASPYITPNPFIITWPFIGAYLPTNELPCAYYMSNVVLNEEQPYFDGAPGGARTDILGLRENFNEIAAELDGVSPDIPEPSNGRQFMNHVPTVSALDIQGEWSNELLFMDIKTEYEIDRNITPFDGFYASEISNLKHVEIDDEIKNFFFDNISLWSALPGNLVLNDGDRFNHGQRLRLFDNTVINNGGILAVNGGGNTGIGGGAPTPDNSEFKVSSFFGCTDTNITVEDGGLFLIGDPNTERIGIATLHQGNTVHIKSGGNLNIVKNSKLIIEAGATLRIEAGAHITLKDYNSNIEIREGGILEIIGGNFSTPSFNFAGNGSFTIEENAQVDVLGDALHLKGSGTHKTMLQLLDNAKINLPAGTDLVIEQATINYNDYTQISAEGGRVKTHFVELTATEFGGATGLLIQKPAEVDIFGTNLKGFLEGISVKEITNDVVSHFRFSNFTANIYGLLVQGAANDIHIRDCGFELNRAAAGYFEATEKMVIFNNTKINGDIELVREVKLENIATEGLLNNVLS